jgi:cellobiose-specific phosphotransferase system component IIB
VDFTPVLDAVATKPTLSEMEASSVLANKTDITTAQTSIETKIDAIPETDLTGIATTTDVTTAKDNILTAINDIPETDLTLVAKESTVQKIKQNTDLITATL